MQGRMHVQELSLLQRVNQSRCFACWISGERNDSASHATGCPLGASLHFSPLSALPRRTRPLPCAAAPRHSTTRRARLHHPRRLLRRGLPAGVHFHSEQVARASSGGPLGVEAGQVAAVGRHEAVHKALHLREWEQISLGKVRLDGNNAEAFDVGGRLQQTNG